jgi:NADP-dependent 3-hydroxy acid dehydrogenase YdfG
LNKNKLKKLKMRKTAIISGASRGIGRAIATTLAKHDFNVALLARNKEDLHHLEHEIGANVKVYALDIANEQEVVQAVNDTLKSFGRIDVVINNAGAGIFKPTEEILAEEWDTLMNTNVKGTFLLTKATLPHMKAQKSGMIIGIASDVSKRVFPSGSLYCATKYAQDAYLSAVRKEVRKDGIKVSLIYPGLVDTYFHNDLEGSLKQNQWLKSQDIANAVLYICQAPDYVVLDELMVHPISQEY